MNPVEPSGTKFSTWFSADNLFTGVIMAFLLVILVIFLLPVSTTPWVRRPSKKLDVPTKSATKLQDGFL